MKYWMIIGILIILSGCAWFGAEDEQIEVPSGIDASSTAYEEYASCVEQCSSCEENCLNSIYYIKALQEEDTKSCARIVSETLKEDCEQTVLATEAVQQLNKEKCMMLTEEATQESCLVHVAAEAAVQSSSSDKCSEAPDVERCENIFYKDMAVLNNDATYCNNIEDEEKKEVCYLVVTEEESETVSSEGSEI